MREGLRFTVIVLTVLLVVLALSACNSFSKLTASSVPTQTPASAQSTPTVVGASEITIAPSSPTAALTDTPEPTATPTATATKRAAPVASRPRATPTAAISPGVYVTAIKTEQAPTKSNESPQFIVTFLNTTGKPQTYRWFIKIYTQDQPQSFGETSRVDSTMNPQTSSLRAFSDWKTITVVDCLFFIARVFWADENNQVHEFLKPDGSNPATGFYVCPQ